MKFEGILFLDIDGVICTDRAYHAFGHDILPGGREICRAWDPISLKLVDRLCLDFNLGVVVSSTWRQYEDHSVHIISRTQGFRAPFHDHWQTPQLKSISAIRGDEINDWLYNHKEYDKYIILDDNTDFTKEQIAKHFVQTDSYDGILNLHYMKARKLLRNQGLKSNTEAKDPMGIKI